MVFVIVDCVSRGVHGTVIGLLHKNKRVEHTIFACIFVLCVRQKKKRKEGSERSKQHVSEFFPRLCIILLSLYICDIRFEKVEVTHTHTTRYQIKLES
jgi:hypothetical protein